TTSGGRDVPPRSPPAAPRRSGRRRRESARVHATDRAGGRRRSSGSPGDVGGCGWHPRRMTDPANGGLGGRAQGGVLRGGVLPRPGVELERLTPGNMQQLLFDDVLWAERAREEHDAFASLLRGRGVVVHLFTDLLAEALDVPGARTFLGDRLATATRFGPALDGPLREVLDATDAGGLAERLVGGVLKADVPQPRISSLLYESLRDDDFLVAPLPNHPFQRDNVPWVYGTL